MEQGWGLGTHAELTWFATIRFRSLRDGLYPGEGPAFPKAVGAPFWSHRSHPSTVVYSTMRQVARGSGLLDSQLKVSQLPLIMEG